MATNGLNYASSGLTFTTNSVKREIIDTSGNHGFGTLSPSTLVHISGATNPVTIEGLSSGSDVRILASDANGVLSYRDDVLVGGSIANNTITLTDSDGTTAALTVQAVTAVTYNNAWDIALAGTGTIGSSPIDLPFITSGSFSNGTITLSINGGLETDIEITGIDGTDTFVYGGSYDSGTGSLSLDRNDGQTISISGNTWDYFTSAAIADNTITLTNNIGNDTDLEVNAIDDLSYDSDWGISADGTGTFSGSFGLPFITGATFGADVLTFKMNDGLESDITVSIPVASDTYSTGGTFSNGTLTIDLNDGSDFDVTGLWTSIPNSALVNQGFTLGSTVIELGDVVGTVAGLSSVTSTSFVGELTGNASTATALANAQNFSISGDITASAISFDGTGAVALSATIDNDAVTTDKILDANVTNAKLANSSLTVGSTSIALGATSTTLAGLTSVTSTSFVGALTGNASTASKWAAPITLTLGTDLTGNVSFDGSAGVTLNASLAANTVDTAELVNSSVTNAKLAGSIENAKLSNSSITFAGDTGTNSAVSLGSTLSLTSADNSLLIDGNGAGEIDFSVSSANISLFTISGDTGSVTPTGNDTITWVGGTGIDTSVSGDELTIAIDSSVVTLNGSQTLTNKTINASQLVDGSVTNAKLANSSLTLAGDSGTQTLTLGDTSTFSGGDGIDTVAQSTDTLVISVDSNFVEVVSRKGASNGYASLDANGRVPSSQLPSSAFEYKGNWNASTNSPTLAAGTGDAGDTYRVSVAGTQNLGNGSVTFDVGDMVLYNGATWDKIDNTEAVTSVNGQTGAVSLNSDNIAEGSTNLYDKTVSLSNGTGISTSGTYPNFTITNSDRGSSQNIFKTIAVPSGNDATAGSNSDTLTFISSDSSVSISGGSNTIDVKVDVNQVTNFYTADGTLSGNRTVTQNNNTLDFTGGDFTVDGTTFVVDESASAVAIGAAAPAATAVFEVASTTKGFLFPRMTETQRGNISTPATGLMVYQTDGDEGVYIKKSFGWVQVI